MSQRFRGILAYLAISFGLAWALWAVPLLSLAPGDPLLQFAILPGAFAPAIASLVVRGWVTGEGFADAGLRPRLRRGWRYYLFALLWPLGAAVIIVVLGAALGLSRPAFTVVRAMGEIAPGADARPSRWPFGRLCRCSCWSSPCWPHPCCGAKNSAGGATCR